MVSSSSSAPPLSYADRAKLGKSPSSSLSPTPSSTSTTDVEKSGEDALNGSLLNGLSPQHNLNATTNFWTARKEQMVTKVVPLTASSSSSPTLAASPSLPPAAPLRTPVDVNGVDLADSSGWPQVAAASTPTKDKSDRAPSKDPTTPTPTPKKTGEKTKWVLIPPTELQAAADAATRGRSSPKHTSATTSSHSSPKTSGRGRRLPNEDVFHDGRRRSPSRLATHAYTHPFNSPTRPSSFVLPAAAPHPEPHHPPLTLQKRPASPTRSGPVSGYRDIDDLKLGEGRLVMFGTIGAPSTSADTSPIHRGLGLDVGGQDGDRKRREETWDTGRRVGGGFVIGIAPKELVRTKIAKTARRRSAPPTLALSPEVVDLTDGAWLRDVAGGGIGDEQGLGERKWEFGSSRQIPGTITSSPLPQPLQQLPPQMYVSSPPLGVYAPPLVPPTSVSAPESVVGDPIEYDARSYAYGEPFSPGIDRERRGGHWGPARRGRYAGGRGGPNGSAGRGFGGRRGGGPAQHYGPSSVPYAPAAPYPPPPPPPGPDGYYMGPPYSLPYPQYVPPPVPPYPVPPVMDPPSMRSAPVPMPVTVTSFPIDPTRWYLLGQVEYYFSVQNLCTDFWLRKQMDNRGWVPISVIASFNRVRHLTYDTGLVRDVMALSALVEVQGDKVRLRDRRWEPFILPDAVASDVSEPTDHHHQQYALQSALEAVHIQDGAEYEGDEEEEVVFVMGKEGEDRRSASTSWAPTDDVEQQS